MTSDQLTKMLIEIIDNAPPAGDENPTELERQIQTIAGLSPAQAAKLAEVIGTYVRMSIQADRIARHGGIVDIPSEWP